MVVYLRWLFNHILWIVSYISWESWGFFTLLLYSLTWVKIIGYIMAWKWNSFVAHQTILLPSLYRLIWMHCTHKMMVRYILPSVYSRSAQFSQSSFMHYAGLCVFSVPIYVCDDCENMCLFIVLSSSNPKYESLVLLRAPSWNNGIWSMYACMFSSNVRP